MRAFGATVELIDSPEGITPTTIPRMMARAAEIVDRDRRLPDRPVQQHRHGRRLPGPRRELAEQLDGRLDAVVLYVGTAGCYLGTTRALRERIPAIHRVAVEPAESPVLGGGSAGHPPDRGRRRRVPAAAARRSDEIDEVIAVSTADAIAMARRAAREDGVWSGPSTGANLTAALAVARRLGPGARVATVQVDSGLKYLRGEVYA